jgi:hypothetical protein
MEEALTETATYRNEVDAAENGAILAHEREATEPEYPCPPDVWIGPWADIANLLGIRDWRVWMGITAALSARAHRNIHCAYYEPLWGMGYWLLVAPSATGKSLTTTLCRHLLPEHYEIFTSVESGQALAESIATITQDEHTKKVTAVTATPSILISAEWTRLLGNMLHHGSTLLECLCEIADGIQTDLNRAKQGKLRIHQPTLTLCATTTELRYQKTVSDDLVSSGTINRHFILPGPNVAWRYNSPLEHRDYSRVRQYVTERFLRPHTFGNGKPMGECYSREAFALDEPFGEELASRYHHGKDTGERSPFTRLHAYNRRIQCLYAWAMHSDAILTSHVRAAHAAVHTSERYLRFLHDDTITSLPPLLKANASIEEKILSLVSSEPHIRKDSLCQRLRKNGGYTAISSAVEKLLQSNALELKVAGKTKLLSLSHP